MSNQKIDLKPVKNAEEALEAAGMKFEIAQSELLNPATGKTSERAKMLYRSDTGDELGVVGIDYGVVQYSDSFAFFDTICKENNAHYTQAISYNNGSKIILKAQFDETFEIDDGDGLKKGITLINSCDGTKGFNAHFTVERLVCTNGLRAIVPSAKHCVKLKHTKYVQNRMDEALRVFAISQNYYEKFEETAKQLTQKIMDSRMVEQFLEDLCGDSDRKQIKERRDKILELFQHGKGNNGTTAWDMYNGVTEYVDHFMGKNEERRLYLSEMGQGVDLKERAFSELMEV